MPFCNTLYPDPSRNPAPHTLVWAWCAQVVVKKVLPRKDMFKSTRFSKVNSRTTFNLPILLRGKGEGVPWHRNGKGPFSKSELESKQRDLDKAMARLVSCGPGSDGERSKEDGRKSYTVAAVQQILQQTSLDRLHARLLEVPPFVQVLGTAKNAVETDAAATQLCLTEAFQGTAGGRIALPGHAEWEMFEWEVLQAVHHAPYADVNDRGVARTCGMCRANQYD